MLIWVRDLVMLCQGGIAVRLKDKSFIFDLGVGYNRNRIIRLETGTEPTFWLIPFREIELPVTVLPKPEKELEIWVMY